MLEALGIVLLVLILTCMGAVLFILGLLIHKTHEFVRHIKSLQERK